MQMKKKRRTTEYYLPDDVLMDVLSRVPVKSLLRFKSVSKHWCSLILNSYFISLHRSRAQTYYGVFHARDRKWCMCFLPDQTSIHDVDLSFAGLHGIPCFSYIGSCNGLVCFSKISDVVICNPATKEYRLLPQPPYHTRQWLRTCRLAFGFDSKNNDYIVVRVVALSQTTCVDHKIHVYGMGADLWEEIAATVPNPEFFTGFDRPCISLDGVFYWLNYDSTTGVYVINDVNAVERLFEQISLPAGLSSTDLLDICLLNDSLALLQHDSKRGEMWFDVWLMDKYGVEDFWTKKYTIGPLTPLLGKQFQFRFQANSKVLLIGWINNRQILSYDHRTKDIKEYNQLRNVPRSLFIIDVFPYVESLVPIKCRVATSANS